MEKIYTIVGIKSMIKNKNNFIEFLLNDKYINHCFADNSRNNVILEFEKKLRSYLNITLLEIELLINSFLVPTYYQPGELLPNGSIAKSNNYKYYIKSWKVILNSKIEEIRVKNKHLLFNFEIIKNIYTLRNQAVYKTPDSLVHISVDDKTETYLFTTDELKESSGLNPSEFYLLHNSFIAPVCYKEGEISEFTGWVIPKHPDYNNTIIKELNLRVPTFSNSL